MPVSRSVRFFFAPTINAKVRARELLTQISISLSLSLSFMCVCVAADALSPTSRDCSDVCVYAMRCKPRTSEIHQITPCKELHCLLLKQTSSAFVITAKEKHSRASEERESLRCCISRSLARFAPLSRLCLRYLKWSPSSRPKSQSGERTRKRESEEWQTQNAASHTLQCCVLRAAERSLCQHQRLLLQTRALSLSLSFSLAH